MSSLPIIFVMIKFIKMMWGGGGCVGIPSLGVSIPGLGVVSLNGTIMVTNQET